VAIEKVSRYIVVNVHTSGSAHSTLAGRKVLLSLARVRWLERDPNYIPPPPLENEVETEDVSPRYDAAITPREELAHRLRRDEGMTYREIAAYMGITEKSVASYICVAKQKLGNGKNGSNPDADEDTQQ